MAAQYKGKSSEVTGSNAALFEINQIYGPNTCIDNKCFCNFLNEFSCRLDSFLMAGGGVGGYHQEK